MTKYQQAKQQLKAAAKNIKKDFPTDKPAQRMYINDSCNLIANEYYYRLTERQKSLLHDYAAKLHP